MNIILWLQPNPYVFMHVLGKAEENDEVRGKINGPHGSLGPSASSINIAAESLLSISLSLCDDKVSSR